MDRQALNFKTNVRNLEEGDMYFIYDSENNLVAKTKKMIEFQNAFGVESGYTIEEDGDAVWSDAPWLKEYLWDQKHAKLVRRYYSCESAHGSEFSYGFSNDTIVRVFESKQDRDKYVADATNISVRPIKRSEVTFHAANWDMRNNCLIQPKPFSGQFWGIVSDPYDSSADPVGQIGTVEVVDDPRNPWLVDKFY